MANEMLKQKIRMLAGKLQEEKLIEHQLSGFEYIHSPVHQKLWKEGSVHRIKPKKKYTYIDYGHANNQSGLFLVENATGNVFGIKAYGKRGRYMGSVDKQIEVADHNITQLRKALQERRSTGHFGLKLQGRDVGTWVG